MKSLIKKRIEAEQRAEKRASLSTSQKLQSALASPGNCVKEVTRLTLRLEREEADAKIAKEAQAMATEAENKRREINRIKALNEAKMKGKVVIPSAQVEARKR